MKKPLTVLGMAVAIGALLGAWAVSVLLRHGLSARDEPTRMEAFLARRLRHWAVPSTARETQNPVPATTQNLARAREHFADHCASCHGNDGRGRTSLGQGLYPKAPDMTLPETQRLSDGELFYIIENGVRLTGMPAWGAAGRHDTTESWALVQFIRHLPKISAEEIAEMEQVNPRSRSELAAEEDERRFLAGEDLPVTGQSTQEQRHDH